MADNVEIQGLEFQIQENSAAAVSGLEALRGTLEKLKTVTQGGVSGLRTTANQIKAIADAASKIDGNTANKIKTIAGALTSLKNLGNVKLSSSIATQLTNLSTALRNIQWTDGDRLEALANGLKSLTALGRSNLTSFITQLGKLPQVIKDLDDADLDKFTQQMKELATAIKPFADEMNKVAAGFSAFPSKIQAIISSTNRYNNAIGGAASTTKTFGTVLSGLKFTAVIYALRRVAGWIGTAITESNEYQENLNLFTVAMGDYAKSAQAYAEQVAEIMGIDPSDWMRNQGVFNTLLTGFGNASDRAALMSKNLTQLGYDLSSFFNISIEDAMQKLQSGISGELEPLRRLGYDLSQARLEAVALSLGIDKSVSSMTQAEKAELRYYAIMTQVATAQGDLARTLEAPANQLRILQAQFTQAARAIGNIFIPALNAILPYAIAVVQVIRDIANAIAGLFGFKLTEVDYSGIGNLASGSEQIADGLTEAAGAAKKLQQYTAGIDELNVFSPQDASGGGGAGGAGGAGGGFEFELPDYDFIGDAVQTKIAEIKAMIESSLWDITAMVSGFSLALGTILLLTGANIPLGLGLIALGAAGLVAAAVVNWNSMDTQLAETLASVTALVSGFFFGLGAIMLLTGNMPVGIALMVAGAASLITSAAVTWKGAEDPLKTALESITTMVAGFLFGLGLILALTGGSLPFGIAMMVAGASTFVSAKAVNWKTMESKIQSVLTAINLVVSAALLAVGAVLAFSGANLPLGIGLIAAGAVSMASTSLLNWDGLSDEVKEKIAIVSSAVSVALLAVGAILAFSGASIPLGIGLMLAGATTMGSSVIPRWNSLSNEVKNTISVILAALGGALLAVGAILAFTGVGIPLGIGLMLVGAASLGTAAALNWNTVVNSVKTVVSSVTAILGGSLIVLGALLCLSGAGIGLGLAVLAAGLGLSYTAWTLDDNPITNFIRNMANAIIGILNRMIAGINDMFHIKFSGLTVAGFQVIPAFDVRLINLPSIPTFADGGFPDEGQLFIAREAGAEMVGNIGRKTAVANNDQIVESISSGVTVANEGVIAAIYALIQALEEKEMSVSIGDDDIGQSYDRYNSRRGVRVNTGAFANAY